MEKLKEPNIGTHKSHCFRVDVYYVCYLEILEPCWDREGIQPQLDLGVRMDTNLVEFSPYIPPNKSQIAI